MALFGFWNMARKKTSKRRPSRRPKQFSPVPPGFRTVTPYLVVSGAAQAVEFYKKAFNAKEQRRETTPDRKILHSRLKIGDSVVMLSDEFAGSDMKSPTSLGTSTVTLHVYTNDVDKLWQQAVAAGAKVVMPIDNQFWGERYGQLADPFGHRWSLSSRIKMSRQEMEAKRQAAMTMFAEVEHPAQPEERQSAQGSDTSAEFRG
jgi:uncharacterized glyoxalase superfamily protein PhnB